MWWQGTSGTTICILVATITGVLPDGTLSVEMGGLLIPWPIIPIVFGWGR